MNQKGFAPIILIFLVSLILVGVVAYNLGKSRNETLPSQAQLSNSSPVISTIQTPQDSANWVQYSIKTLELRFKLPPDLAKKYGKLVEKEIKGQRGSELEINFENDPKSLIMTAQSPEYTPIPPIPVPMTEQERRDQAIGGPGISTPSVFQGFKIVNDTYYGVLPLGQLQDLPTSAVTQYHVSGRDIIKVKALYSQFGSASHRIYPENPPKIWAVITTGNQIYPGLTIQGILDKELTESVFEQILSPFANW